MNFINCLATVLKLEVSFLISPNLLIKFGTKIRIFKLKQNGVSGDLLNILIDFLKEKKQRVVLNVQHSKWSNISAGVPQGLLLGLLLFLIYVNSLSSNSSSNLKLFADDTLLFLDVHDINQSGFNLNDELGNKGTY